MQNRFGAYSSENYSGGQKRAGGGWQVSANERREVWVYLSGLFVCQVSMISSGLSIMVGFKVFNSDFSKYFLWDFPY